MQGSRSFSSDERDAVYRAIYARRDIRNYRPDPVPEEVLGRILAAAHQAGSVGFMQPWNFLVIRDQAVRQRVYSHFREVNEHAATLHPGERADTYRSLKLQGILDAPLNLLITCDPDRGGPHVLGRATIRETDVYSTCLAVQNLWLAARAEGVGVGWMSLMEPQAVREILGIPERVILVAYLTVGYPVEFPDEPMLERVGWRAREPLAPLVFEDAWDRPATVTAPEPNAAPADAPALEQPAGSIRERLDQLTKPAGSLGRLEHLACRLAEIQGGARPRARDKALLLVAGDHGVTAEGVSAYHPKMTHQMVYQFVAGGGAVNAFARQHGVRLTVADLGVDHDFGAATGVIHAKVRRGTRNFALESAMTHQEATQALEAGRRLVRELGPCDVLAVGEMGIGNSTAASALVCALLGGEPGERVGIGTGVGTTARHRKADAIRRALARDAHAVGDPSEALRCFGGYEIAALVGAIEEAALRRIPVLLDGFITGAAALVAARRTPSIRGSLIAAHRSAEPAHGAVLEALELSPLLELDLRLGEGSGAVLAMGLVESACRMLSEMRTFEEANIDEPLDPRGLD